MGEFASHAQSNLNTVLGSIGTAGALMGGLLNLGGMANNCNSGCNGGCNGGCSENQLVNRYELTLQQELAAKDAEIGLLKADKYTDEKLVEVYKDLQGQINALQQAQNQVNMQQAVYNATNTAAISCIQNQIAQLQSLTKLVVPNTSVCPGWGNVTITPATTTTTTPAA